ncbi:MAG: zinc ABC transporter substrate-binding protein [Clostridia bacterium]|nr:zinc ABC transporter substrate-binding protein [Clostridia bacterium]
MKRFVAVLIVVCLLFSLAACSGGNEERSRLHIISTIFPSYDFARQITKGIDGVEVTMLIPPGTEPHAYEPSVQDMAQIKECDLFIYLGGESDQWVEELLATFDKGEINTIKMIDCVPLLEEETVEGMQAEEHHHDDDEISAHGENDEHVWTSPANAITIAEKIESQLLIIDEENADKYAENFTSYKSELSALDQKLTDLNKIGKPIIVADRFPFRYLSEKYDINYYAAFPGCSTESDPSAATIAFLETKIKETGTKAVFYTEFSSQKVADTLCEATGVKKLMLHSCHNVSKSDFENGATYVSLMEQNIKNLNEALN